MLPTNQNTLNATPAIEVEGLGKTYRATTGSVPAVRDVSFAVETGEIFGLLGPNGAGKSTMMLMLATLLSPTAGRARVAGHDLIREAPAVRRVIGVALQETGLDDAQTGSELLTLVGRLHGLGRAEAQYRARELLELLELEEAAGRRVATYSGGMRRRIDLALALVHRPCIIYLDEPTTGLDPAARRTVWDEIHALRLQGLTVLLTTQYLEEADRLCDRVAIIDRGSIAAHGTPVELKRSLGGDVIEVEMRAPEAAVTAAAALGDGASVRGRSVRLTADDGRSRIPALVAELQQRGLELAGLSLVEPTLDDVFLELTGRRRAGDGGPRPEDEASR